ncbi:unnamed protein product [Symbiodinium sp. CCMP2592]|nr:unnamed protein product [Symbiodinium sp. CCMP2592]
MLWCLKPRDDLTACERTLGDLNGLYKRLCDLELTTVEPKHFTDITKEIRDTLWAEITMFGNNVASLKSHVAPKPKRAAKPAAAKEEECDAAVTNVLMTYVARNFNNAVTKRGFALRIPISHVKVLAPDGNGMVNHPILCIQDTAKEIFRSYEDKLFAGRSVPAAQGLFLRFWRTFRQVQPNSKVFQIHSQDELQFCIPCKIHMDEGTGVRKSAVLQCSWGPVLASGAASWLRYFFWTAMGHESYRQHNMGWEWGNEVLDSLTEELAKQATSAMETGIATKHGTFFLCFISLEGDLPAQAKVFHCVRNFLRVPNPMCPWCSADGDTIPFTDVRAGASWRATVGQHVPWSVEPPLAALTRNGEASFLAQDIFHVVNLGIGRTFFASALCFLIHLGHFIPTDQALGRSIPVRIDEAYNDFKHFCKHVMKMTPMVKHWTRENLGWKGPDTMPSTSFKASDTYLMLSWLVDYLQRPFEPNNYIKNMFACAHSAAEALDRFLIKYIRLAFDANNDRKQLSSQQRILNPMAFSTAMAEDYVGLDDGVVLGKIRHWIGMGLALLSFFL